MKTLLPSFISILGMSSAGAAVVAFEFNTPGNTEGWSTPAAPAGALVTGFKAATGIDGINGVLTSEGVEGDPQILRSGASNLISLPSGESWATLVIRFRQLSGDPGSAGTAPATFVNAGLILFFNGSLNNRTPGPGGISTQIYSGTGTGGGATDYSSDTYNMSLTTEATGEWQLMNLSFSAAPKLASQDFSAVRFDPIGNNAAGNFEIDYIRFTSVPEPTGTLLSSLAATGLILRRRRK